MLTREQVLAAQSRLHAHLFPTPGMPLPWLDKEAGGAVFAKPENLQRTGSFKFRGAMNALLQLEEQARARGVVTASAGNHGLGVAEAAAALKTRAVIFVPENATPFKRKKLEGPGVQLLVEGADYDEAELAAQKYARRRRLKFIHAFDDDEVIAGQGTVGAELLQEPLRIGTVIVPVGGGGLLGGVSLAIKAQRPQIRILGVQSEASPAMWAAWQKGAVVETPIAPTVADGLAGRFVTEKTLRLAQQYCDEILLVREGTIRQAMKEIFARQGWRLEGSAAASVAAIWEGQVRARGETCVVILTGGNIAPETFARQIQPGAAS